MHPMRQGGIALATAVTAYLNNFILLYILRRDLGRMPLKSAAYLFVRTAAVSVIAGFAAWFAYRGFCGIALLERIPKHGGAWFLATCVFGAVFALLAFLFRIREATAVVHALKRKFLKRS